MKTFSLSLGMFYLIYIFCCVGMIFVGPIGLKLIRSNATLPTVFFMGLYCVVSLLEQNHSLFAGIIALNNSIPYVKPSIISGGIIVVGYYIVLRFTNIGLYAMVLIPGIVQLSYNNWKWPQYVCRQYNLKYFTLLKKSIVEVLSYGRKAFDKH